MAKSITFQLSCPPIIPVNQIEWSRLVNSELVVKPHPRLGFVSKHDAGNPHPIRHVLSTDVYTTRKI